MPRKKRHPGWPEPAPELVRFVRALAAADAEADFEFMRTTGQDPSVLWAQEAAKAEEMRKWAEERARKQAKRKPK